MTSAQTVESVSVRPVVHIQGRPNPLLSHLISALVIDEQRGGLTTLELRLRNQRSVVGGGAGRAFDSDDVFVLGQEIAAGMGDEAEPASMFHGYISAIEESFEEHGAPQLCVLAEDPLQKARLARRSRVHEALSIPAFCDELARALGLRAVVSGFDSPIGTQVQLNESDLAFLRRLLAERDGELQVVEEELHVQPVKDVWRQELELTAGRQLLSVRLSADLAHQVTEMSVSGWDAAAGTRIAVTSAPPSLGPGDGPTGAEWLERSGLGTRREHIAHVPVRDEAEAQALANSAHAQRAREFVKLTATARGNPFLRAGLHVRLRGVSERFENTYVITRTCHRYERGTGYRTEFEAECAHLKEGA